MNDLWTETNAYDAELAAKDREIAALRKELGQTKALALAHFTTGCSPAPDPAEAMRAKDGK